jgi:hypothetical protein
MQMYTLSEIRAVDSLARSYYFNLLFVCISGAEPTVSRSKF